MIIFDLDGTLADCEHRRHFLEKDIGCDHWYKIPNPPLEMCDECKIRSKKWKPDWKSFFESCHADTPIWPVVRIFTSLALNKVIGKNEEIQIWSGRCESTREKTVHWLKYIMGNATYSHLKMRPFADYTPDNELKEAWLDESIKNGKNIEFVFDDRPKVVRMWQRRGIFVFNCLQSEEEF